MSWQYFFKSRVASWVMSIALLFVMVFAAKILIQKYKVDKEIAKLEDQAQKIKKDNEQLSSLVQYFNTPEYQEKAARERLNLQKNGEIVVGLPSISETVAGAQTTAGNSSNYKKWFDYFFSKSQ